MIQESEARLPGWTVLKNTDNGTVRYRSPKGQEVGRWAYNATYKHFKDHGIVHDEPIGNRWKKFQGSSSNNKQDTGRMQQEIPIPDTEDSILIDVPEPKTTTQQHRKTGLFTSKELGGGYAAILVILTSILAVALKVPEAQMTETEVRAISIPLGNITERSRYNKVIGSVIVEKSDYLTLGYALYTYTDRVASSVREKKRNDQPAGYAQQTQGTTTGGASSGGGSNGVHLPIAPTGLRSFTGNA